MATATVTRENFRPVSDLMMICRKDFAVADPTLVNPLNAIALTDGEWLSLNAVGKVQRATNITVLGDVAKTICFPMWAERGRTDVQALSARKVPVFYMGQYEAETRIFDATTVVGAGAAMTALLQPVKVATIQATVMGAGVRNFTGLVGASYDDPDPIVGYITALPANNGGKLRFIKGWAVQNGVAVTVTP